MVEKIAGNAVASEGVISASVNSAGVSCFSDYVMDVVAVDGNIIASEKYSRVGAVVKQIATGRHPYTVQTDSWLVAAVPVGHMMNVTAGY